MLPDAASVRAVTQAFVVSGTQSLHDLLHDLRRMVPSRSLMRFLIERKEEMEDVVGPVLSQCERPSKPLGTRSTRPVFLVHFFFFIVLIALWGRACHLQWPRWQMRANFKKLYV